MANQDKFSPSNFVISSKSYLILIVSLVALICLFVGIAATSQTLETVQRWILIVFVIVFAICGTSVSVWLLLRESRRAAAGKENRKFGWKSSSTDSQRRKLNDEVREIAAALSLTDTHNVFSAYIVAQDLALRQIQQETKETVWRQMSVGSAEFDAVLLKHDVITGIEFAFLVSPDISQAKINDVLKKVAIAKRTFERSGKDANMNLLFVLVTQLDPAGEAELRSTLVKKFSATSVDVDIRMFDFEGLQKIYTVN